MSGEDISREARHLLEQFGQLDGLIQRAQEICLSAHGRVVTYSPKAFFPITRLCRDFCAYCTFAKLPREVQAPYMSRDEVLALARQAKSAGCMEALFTLGDRPETRHPVARDALRQMGFATTVDYVADLCATVLKETGLLPHVNAGVLTRDEMAKLRGVSVSQGLMLEQSTPRLSERGGPHFGSPDKDPSRRLAMIEEAGQLAIPFTSGILIGIGETRLERIESLLTLRCLHRRYGHLQEIIVQNFRAKSDTRMAGESEPGLDDILWTAAMARLIMDPDVSIQVPPNLSFADFPRLLSSGINDWGGISPITPDHVNPEAPWPELERLNGATVAAGRVLVPRLGIYPAYVRNPERWLDPSVRTPVVRASDSDGFARIDAWSPGLDLPAPRRQANAGAVSPDITSIIEDARSGRRPSIEQVTKLLSSRGADEGAVIVAADAARAEQSGDRVTYVVTRNINYTNVCQYACTFCAFSKGKSNNLRGKPYDLDLDEVVRRAHEAWDRGATELCLQGGIHPDYSGRTYLSLLTAIKQAVPQIHIHAFSPLEVRHGARSLGIGVDAFLKELRAAGLGSLPGTAAEILADDVREIICPEKLSTLEWLEIVRTAHEVGLKTTSTIMFGHVEQSVHCAQHLLAIRDLQEQTRGFTEFVPLPFVHMEAPIYHRGQARRGPTYREAVLMTAVARLVLSPMIPSIQVSWVKMGLDGVAACLQAGANDLGGTLMNESISRAAGTQHGQEMVPERMEAIIEQLGRVPQQRTTLYGAAPADRYRAARDVPPLADLVLPAAGKFARIGSRHALGCRN